MCAALKHLAGENALGGTVWLGTAKESMFLLSCYDWNDVVLPKVKPKLVCCKAILQQC